MPPLTLNQAAKAAKKSKSTLLDAIQSGRLSAIRNDLNQWQIDPAELFRVYPANQSETTEENHDRTPENQSETAILLKKEQEERERERAYFLAQIEDLKTDRDQWRHQATALLTHQPKPEATAVPDQLEERAKPKRKKGGFWKNLFRLPSKTID